jgi:hypothetical protein
MKRAFAIAACGLSLAGCASMPSWMQFDLPRAAPAATTMQFESEPAGAEARTSTGQSCRTPCSLAVSSPEFTVSFSLQGYQPQNVPVRVVASTDPVDADAGQSGGPRLVPNPVFVELQPAGPPPAAARRRPAPPREPARTSGSTRPATAPRSAQRPAPSPMAAQPAPAPAPASPWPPPPAR